MFVALAAATPEARGADAATDASAVMVVKPVQELTLPEPDAEAWFGATLASDGDTLMVGARGAYQHPWTWSSGAVNIFSESATGFSWDQQFLVSYDAFGEIFGTHVAFSGDLAAISSSYFFGSSGSIRGWVHVLRRSDVGWERCCGLNPGYPEGLGAFGASLAIVGDAVAAGAPSADVSGGEQSGSVLIYESPSSGHVPEPVRLVDAGAEAYAGFGNTLAALGSDTLFVAEPNADVGGNQDEGSVFVYVRSDAGWVLQQRIEAPDPEPSLYFGQALAVSGSTLLVACAPPQLENRRVFVFAENGGVWEPAAVLQQPPGGALSSRLAVDGSRAAVAGYKLDDSGFPAGWEVYVFEQSGAVWSLRAKLLPPGTIADREGVGSVALRGDTVVVGVPNATVGGQQDQGAVYVYRVGAAVGVPTLQTGGLILLILLLVSSGVAVLAANHRG